MTREALTKVAAIVSVVALVVGVGVFGAPTPAQAQDGNETGESTAGEASAETADESESTGEGEETTQGETGGEAAQDEAGSEESTDSGGETAESGGQDAESQGDEASQQSEAGGDASAESGGEDSETSGAETGPGGRELRQDYPGTEESKQSSMNTDRIEGLQFDEGQDPSEAYDMQVKELETKIDDLKEEVFQSKSRIVLLKETVLGGNLSGSRAKIVHESRLGSQFKLTRALYSLDGSRVYNKVGRDALKNKNEFTVYDGSITAGNHNVSIVLEYKGSGYGLFNYMGGYEVRITSSCQFQAQAGKATTLRVRAVKKGGAFTRPEERPGIQCRITDADLAKESMESLEAGGAEGDGAESGSGESTGAEAGGDAE